MKIQQNFNGLDLLRALAISLVFTYHYTIFMHPAWMDNDFVHFCWCGVDLFFVLSGFLISNQLFMELQNTNHINHRVFYAKRIFRIFPPYFFVLLIYIFIPAFHEHETLPPLWKFFTFTQNFGLDITHFGTFSHAWSLCVEEQFYLLLPLLLVLIFSGRFAKKAGWLIIGIFVLTLALRWITWIINGDTNWYKWIYYPTYTRLDGLIVGVGIAAVYRFRPTWLTPLKKYGRLILFAGLILFAVSNYICRDQKSEMTTLFGFSLIAIAFGFFVLSSILPGSILFRSNSAITTNLAILSYSLYLSHKGIIHLTQKWLVAVGLPGDSNWMLLICIFTCLIGAGMMRLLIEKPFLALRNQYLANYRKKSIVPDMI